MSGLTLIRGIQDITFRQMAEKADNFMPFEDFGDRLNRLFTTTIISILSGVTMANIYFLRSISCILPEQNYNSAVLNFVESVCWMQGVLNFKPNQINNQTDWIEVQKNSRMLFYPWIPFLLLVQALLFHIPCLLWQELSYNTLGDHFSCIFSRAKAAKTNNDKEQHERLVNACAEYLLTMFRHQVDYRESFTARFQRKVISKIPISQLCVFGKRLGNRAAILYLLIKLLYITNCILQFWLIMRLLGPSIEGHDSALSFMGELFEIILSLRIEDGGILFPLQTVCPVNVTTNNKKQNIYFAVCTLPVNLLNEKIFLFLWAWIFTVLITSVIFFIVWTIRLLVFRKREEHITNLLKISYLAAWSNKSGESALQNLSEFNEETRKNVRSFVQQIGLDGSFIIRMLKINAGDVVTGEILLAWWRLFATMESTVEEINSN